MRHFGRLVFIVITVLRFGLDDTGLVRCELGAGGFEPLDEFAEVLLPETPLAPDVVERMLTRLA